MMVDRTKLTNDFYAVLEKSNFVPRQFMPLAKPILMAIVNSQPEDRLIELMQTGQEILQAIQNPDQDAARATLNRILIDPLLKNGNGKN